MLKPKKQCAKILPSKKRCSNWAVPGSNFCSNHQPFSAATRVYSTTGIKRTSIRLMKTMKRKESLTKRAQKANFKKAIKSV